MAAFSKDEIKASHYIWSMVRDGGVSCVSSETLLETVVFELQELGYLVHRIDAGPFENTVAFEKNLRRELSFPNGASGHTNLDAFRDCLGDLDFKDCKGRVIAIQNADALLAMDGRYLHNMMDVFCGEAHYHLCLGNRLLLVLQFSSGDIQLPSIGCHPVAWDARS